MFAGFRGTDIEGSGNETRANLTSIREKKRRNEGDKSNADTVAVVQWLLVVILAASTATNIASRHIGL